jgi:hypothetical protein
MFFIMFCIGFLFGSWFVSGREGTRGNENTICIRMAKTASEAAGDAGREMYAKVHLLKTILGVQTN